MSYYVCKILSNHQIYFITRIDKMLHLNKITDKAIKSISDLLEMLGFIRFIHSLNGLLLGC